LLKNKCIQGVSIKGRLAMSMQDEDVVAEFEEVAAAHSDGAEVAHEAEAEADVEEEHGDEDAAESDEDEEDDEEED
jgi:hypothetical protein